MRCGYVGRSHVCFVALAALFAAAYVGCSTGSHGRSESPAPRVTAVKLPHWLSLRVDDQGRPGLSGVPGVQDVGKHEVVLEVSDGIDTARQSFVVEVNSTNRPPAFVSTPTTSANQGEPYNYVIETADPDNLQASTAGASGGDGEAAAGGLPQQAMAIMAAHCLGCHNAEKHKGDLDLTARDAALEFGALTPGDPAESLMLQVLAPDAEPHMPPKRQLADTDIQTLRAWITAGAQWSDTSSPTAAADTSSATLAATFQPVMAMVLSPDGGRLAFGRGSTIHIHNVAEEGRPMIGTLTGHKDVVRSLAFTDDGRWLASGGDRRVILWDTESMQKAAEVAELSGRITSLAFSPDGSLLAAADGQLTRDSIIRLWQMPDLSPKAHWPAHQDTVFDLAIGGGGQWIATAGADKLVKLWDLHTHAELAKFEGHAGHVLALAFNPDSTRLATGGADQRIKVWNVEERKDIQTIHGHRGAITALVWTPIGNKIVTACEDGLVRMSQHGQRDVQATFEGAAQMIYAVTSHDASAFYAGGHDGSVYIWAGDGTLQAKLEAAATLPQP